MARGCGTPNLAELTPTECNFQPLLVVIVGDVWLEINFQRLRFFNLDNVYVQTMILMYD